MVETMKKLLIIMLLASGCAKPADDSPASTSTGEKAEACAYLRTENRMFWESMTVTEARVYQCKTGSTCVITYVSTADPSMTGVDPMPIKCE